MSKEKILGTLLFVLGIVILISYIVTFFSPHLSFPQWIRTVLVEFTVLAIVIAFLVITIRLGWNMMTSPSPKSLIQQETAVSETKEEIK